MLRKCFIIILLLFSSVFLISFIEIKNLEEVYIEILNKDTITDGVNVEFKITNNSNKNYCFLIDTISYKLKTPYPSDSSIMKNDVFHLYNDKNEGVIFYLNDDSCNYNDEVREYNNIINYKKTIYNLVMVKSKSSFTYKLKFNYNVYFDDYCRGNFIIDKNNDYFLAMDIKYYDTFLSKDMKDSISSLGYKLYTKKLSSQKVQFKMK